MTLVFRTQNILIANSLNNGNRATGYGLRTTIIQLFSIFAPSIGGILIHVFGGISVEGIGPLYFVQLVEYLLLSTYVSLKLEDLQTEEKSDKRDFFKGYKAMLKTGVGLKRFSIIQALGSITWGMSMPFPFVYAADFKEANSLIIGYTGTCFVIVSMILAVPMGSLADRRERKFAIFLT